MVVEKLDQNLQKLQLWAQHAPMNHQHKVDLILAEKARVAGDVAAAVEHYEAAISGAREYEYIHEEALANELYGRFWDQRGNEAIARLYLREAHALYENWGAAAIVDHLETQYPQWLKTKLTDTGPLRPSTDTREQQADLDLQTVLKASQAIAGEIKLDKLLSRLMKIVIENAGAQRGFLILEQDDQWLIEAFTEVGDSNPQVMQAISITENNLLSAGIVQYVARMQETVVLEDAARNGVFVNDPYIQRHQVKSLLCWPLVNLGKTSGILYVENNLATGVFTPERLELLNLLSSQIAISIDQARIHNSLERLVVERTEALSYTEAQIHALFETSPLGIAMTTLEGQILFTNQTLLQMIGYKEIEAQELNVTSLYHDPEQRFEFLERLQASGIMRDFGIKVARKDGTSFYASLNASALSLPDQDVFLAVLEDVSEKILTEKALNEANKNLISLLEISRTMTAASDLESLLDLILEQLDDLIEYSGAVVWINEEDVLEVRASRTAEGTNTLVGLRLAVDVLPIVGEMLIVKEPIVIDDISDAMALINELESAVGLSLQEYALPGTSLIAFSINAKDQNTGAIAMWKHEPGYFSREKVSLLQGFANQAVIAIDNALLYQEVQQVAVIEERDRLARELHDAVTQTLFSASVIAKAVPDIWEKDSDAGRTYLEQLPGLLQGALAEMRILLLELRPSALQDQTMDQLLEMLVEAARARSGAIVTLKVEGDRPLPEDVTMALHRIAQESLNNVTKHAEARDVNVRLICDPEEVVLHIADDGCGFDPETISSGHLGVGIMRERAQKIGATFQVDSKPGDGTIVTVSWSDQA
jgi:PAS domain S-box-containing protein